MLNKLNQKPVPNSLWIDIKATIQLKQNKANWLQRIYQMFEPKPAFYIFAPVAVFTLFITLSTAIIYRENSTKEVNTYLGQVLSQKYISTNFNDGTF